MLNDCVVTELESELELANLKKCQFITANENVNWLP